MYRIRIKKDFSSAHNLRGYEGDCEMLHGHNWKVEVFLQGSQLDKTGIMVDFRVLKKALKAILDQLDHKYLNELPPFDQINPTSENLSRYIFEELEKSFSGMVYKVRVWESDDAAAEYTAE